MMERLGKRRLNVCMALVAEGGLIRFEQGGLRFGLVDTVATGAADESIAMGGTVKIRVIANMAGQASRSNLFWGCFGELKDLGRVPAAVDVGLAGSVAAFAAGIFRSFLAARDALEMRIAEELVEHRRVASLAGFTADVVSAVGKNGQEKSGQSHSKVRHYLI